MTQTKSPTFLLEAGWEDQLEQAGYIEDTEGESDYGHELDR